MPSTTAVKSSATLIASESITGTTTVRRGRLDVRTALGGKISALITNGAAPSSPAVARIYVAHSTGTLPAEGAADWVLDYEIQHNTVASAPLSIPYTFGPDIQHIMVEIFAANTATTVRAESTRFDSALTT